MSSHNDVADIVNSLELLARERRPEDPLLAGFLALCYSELPVDDVDGRRIEHAYAAGSAHLSLGRVRQPGEIVVEVLSPELDRDGWHSDRSILMFITDDVPFLVDTVRLVLDRHQLGIHLLVHPMLQAVRRSDGRLASIRPTGANAEGSIEEAWTQIEIDRVAPGDREALAHDVRRAIVGVQRAVDDFDAMRDRMRELVDGDRLLDWFAEQHFVFLASAIYDRTADELTLRAGTELGEYRTDGGLDPAIADPPPAPGDRRVVIARTDAVSVIHRAARMTSVAIRSGDQEHRFVGLLGSGAYRESVFAIPVVCDRANEVLDLAGASVQSHTGRAVRNVVETLPRDVVFELDSHTLAQLVIDIVGLQERRIVRVFDVAEPVGPWTTVLVYVPRARFTSALPELVASMAATQYGGEVRDLETLLGTSSLARISMTVRARNTVDLDRLAEAIDASSMTWEEREREALVDALGELEGHRVFELVRREVPFDYQARVRPSAAVGDLINVAALLDGAAADDAATRIVTSFGRSIDADEARWRFRVFLRGRSATIAELVPMLEHLGLSAIDEHPNQFGDPAAPVFLYDIGVTLPVAQITEAQHHELQKAFVGLMDGTIEADGLNRLVLLAGLDTRQVAVLRLYNRYLRQTGFAFTPKYVEQALVRHSAIARMLAQLFDLRFDPTLDRTEPTAGTSGSSSVDERIAALRASLVERLEAVPSLDDDRICRAFLTLIEATTRTTAFTGRDEIAVKLAPHAIAFLPEPRPVFEIFVCSPLVEGVHLRGGRIARGGLRWSDRPEDFRTEVLGLVKAQMVKNAVIVPVGAKGGFVVKNPTADPSDRDAVRIEGIDRYRRFVGALLELTDNIVGSDVVHPDGIVIHDADDTYLVVAADKGTATFSDIANEISIEHGFWLGDAFASGGSNGYDHKAMGITARGAWESVRRHARVIGKDLATDVFTVVGVGDMSGDVFGNGMLLSSHLELVAAFDHRHIFIDPTPDPERSHAERRRLFELARSSWADYDAGLISPGGGVYTRSAKSIALTSEACNALGIDRDPAVGDLPDALAMRPDELISAILRAPVDLLWNGGIGTYVKASAESHEAVGDRANDALRVDAGTLRCRIVGEGGNLGLTQLARVEYAINGGLIFADAIDNSAGVDCSDHEVNIKIVLDQLVREGDVTAKQRNELLANMTDDVAELVLDDNRAQTLALMIARRQSLPMVNVHARYLDTLEAEGYLDRTLEYLPTDKQIAERQSAGAGLCAPEFAVLIAYTKNADVHEILTSDLPDQDALDHELADYFPAALRQRFPTAIERHPLRREIIATRIVNDMVNLAGISFDHRMTEDSGASVSDVTRAFLASRDVFGFGAMWAEIDALGASVDLDTQIDLLLDARRMAERGTVWLLRHRHPPLDISQEVEKFTSGIGVLATSLDDVVTGRVASDIEAARARRIDAGVPADLAARAARWPWLHTGFDIVELASAESVSVLHTATAYWTVFEAFDLGWLWDGIGALPRSDRWQSQARGALRDDLMTVLADLTRSVMRVAGGSPTAWIGANERAVGRMIAMHTEIRRAESFDLTTLSVALRQLRNLTMTAVAATN